MAAEVAAVVPPPYTPPGIAGLVTVIGTAPLAVTADAGTVIVSWPEVTKVVVCAVPFQFTAAFDAKFAPFTVRTKAALLAATLSGASAVMVGAVPACGGVTVFEP